MIRVVNKSKNTLPQYETLDSAGMDIKADFTNINPEFLFNTFISKDNDDKINGIVIRPNGRALIPTGLYTALPQGYEAQIRPRSGLALKKGITVLNNPGTIDADYRNEWGVILINLGTENFTVKQGDRIAQIVINKITQVGWQEVETLDETERKGGFGSTDKKEVKEEDVDPFTVEEFKEKVEEVTPEIEPQTETKPKTTKSKK